MNRFAYNYKGLIRKVQEQISKQVITVNDLQAQSEMLATFNANNTSYKQKECIIKIVLNVREDGIHFEDTFDWEVDAKLNQ